MRKQYWKGMVVTANGELIAAIKNLQIAKDNYNRYRKLYPTGAAPVRTFQEMRATFYEAVGHYESAKANLYEQKDIYEKCTHISPIEGVVDKIYYSRGILVDNPKVLQLEQLNPIGIKVEMSANETEKITPMTSVSIYLKGNEEPFGIYNGYTLFCDDGIIFTTRNTPKRYANIQQIADFFPILNFNIGSGQPNKLGIATPALHKDKNGYYVWKAVNRKIMQPGKGLEPIFKIKKTYITPGKLIRLYNGITNMQILDNPGALELYDIAVTAPYANLKDGDTVTLPPERYILMPGDKVKVVIKAKLNSTLSPPITVSNPKQPAIKPKTTSIDVKRRVGHHGR
jgi:hypothetical protein